MNIQFKKGILEMLVLSLLIEKDRYGYELVNEISKNISISEGTIYPLLRRLNNDGYFETYLKESTEGPPRKYYRITEAGKEALRVLGEEWDKFLEGVGKILKGDKK
ncbi:MAG: PadR family transcriptional regulator [Eubacteriales bacterium]